ncbi:BspA family leucine-rich repeat surface protein [Polaribacter sp.]|nr:BspA family leucine-rich repeat surface protein [Polaribacter sp.]
MSDWDVSKVTDMSDLFKSRIYFNADISAWDVSSVTNMERMFAYAHSFNQNIGSWDVSSVTDMVRMFETAITFNGDISAWDVSSVNNMYGMFYGAKEFNKDIGAWDVSSVTEMRLLFRGATYFYQDISSWCVTNIAAEPYEFSFESVLVYHPNKKPVWGTCPNRLTPITDANIQTAVDLWVSDPAAATTTYGNISDWDVSSVTDMSQLFRGRNTFNDDISNWNVSGVTDMSYMFDAAHTFNQDVSSWDVSSVTTMDSMFISAYAFDQAIGNWNVSNVTNMSRMFYKTETFNQDIGAWNVSSVTDMFAMFTNAILSTDNYDAILISWSQQVLQSNVRFGVWGVNFCNGAAAKQSIIDTYGWTITDGGLDCATASIEDQTQLDISIYPNPTDNTLFITGNETPIAVAIYNVLGKEVLSIKNTNNINVQALPSGVYVIRISDGIGQTNRKFIKN